MEIFSRQRIEPDAEIVKPALTYAPKKIITKTLSEKKIGFFQKIRFLCGNKLYQIGTDQIFRKSDFSIL
jgi:hypothetical protein